MIERYKDKAIHEQWNPTAVYNRWFEVEVAHLREVAGPEAADALDNHVYWPSAQQVNYFERETGHDVMAFLVALDRNVRETRDRAHPDHLTPNMVQLIRCALHYGLTSSDVTDTALALGLVRTRPIVRERAVNLIEAIGSFISGLSVSAETIGRTHGQLAAPMSADHRWDVLAQMLDRTWTRAGLAFEMADVGKLSGPTGENQAAEDAALDRLGLRGTASTQLVPRDRLAHLAHCLAELATVAEAIATQVWLLAQAGIEELRVATNGSVGSSAMPHKRNPILAENIRGLARMARDRAEELQLGMVQWGEHDLAHSSVERVAIPDLLHLVCTALSRTAVLVSGLSWDEPTIPPGYVDTHEELRRLQDDGMPYVDAHAQLTQMYRGGKLATNDINAGEDSGN
jgi:adenylosuccinate lyase